jgi:hypothetical protein
MKKIIPLCVPTERIFLWIHTAKEDFREREATILKMRLGFSGEVKILEEVDQKNGLSG